MKLHVSVLGIGALVLLTAAGLNGQTGFSRVVLQDQPLSATGRHGVTARADFVPDGSSGLHSHPGEELGYIVEGTIALSIGDRPAVTLKKGDVFFIPAAVPHNGRNVGKDTAALVSVFVVEDGKPLAIPISPAVNKPATQAR